MLPVFIGSILNGRNNGRARESDPTRVVRNFVMITQLLGRARSERSGRRNPITVPAEVVGSSIGRLSHHCMVSGDVCDGLELVRRPFNGRGFMRSAVRAPFGGWLRERSAV